MDFSAINSVIANLRGKLTFLNPLMIFIINAAMSFLAFLLFFFQDSGYYTLFGTVFHYAGGILGFLILLGLMAGTIALPLLTKRICTCLNLFLIGFYFLGGLFFVMPWNAISVILVLIVLIPWAAFSLLVKDDIVKLGN